jgi:hypothetical protein
MAPLVRIASAASLAVLACNTERALHQMGFDTSLAVTHVVQRGDFLEATLRGEAGTLRLFVPPSEACRRVLAPEASVLHESKGAGRVSRDGASCDAAGVGPVEELRRRRGDPTSGTASVIPRAQASYRVVYEDAEVVFLRGRFPLANLVGWSGGDDTIAVVSRGGECHEVVSRGVASLELRPRGEATLALVGARGLCPIEALIRPLAAPATSR